jgi:geranylgeranyl diphosphate synthase type I
VTKLRNAGRLLGETFQIRDDWLGSFGDPDRTGKGRTSDLARRKLTYPVVSAFSRASYAEQRRLCQLYADPEAEDGEDQIRDMLSLLGEPAATAAAATQTVNASMSAVASSGLEARWVDDFAAIARFVAHRTG